MRRTTQGINLARTTSPKASKSKAYGLVRIILVTLISGGASGIDSIAEEYADKHRISKLILYPKYEVYGKAAPLKRNEIMVDIADEVLIIWDGKSRGTKYTADYAAKKNKKVRLIIAE